MKVRVDQLVPSRLDPNYIMRRARVEKLREWLDARLPADRSTRLLDVGGGTSPYRVLAGNKPVTWLSADLNAKEATQVVCDAQTLPFGDESFDGVVCLQVWELIPDLRACAAEVRRVLKPGGWAIISNPAVFPPYGGARWRIMPEGYRTLLAEFKSVKVEAECNTVASFFRTLNVYLMILTQNIPVVGTLWNVTLCPLCNVLGGWANGRFHDEGFAANYIVLAEK